jgi:hypothetical protein
VGVGGRGGSWQLLFLRLLCWLAAVAVLRLLLLLLLLLFGMIAVQLLYLM